MKTIPYSRADKDLPENEACILYRTQQRTSPHVILSNDVTENAYCYALKVKGQAFTSDWCTESSTKEQVKKAIRQIRFIKDLGWYDTGETMYDDLKLFKEKKYRCAYCGLETITVNDPCICRRVAASMKRP